MTPFRFSFEAMAGEYASSAKSGRETSSNTIQSSSGGSLGIMTSPWVILSWYSSCFLLQCPQAIQKIYDWQTTYTKTIQKQCITREQGRNKTITIKVWAFGLTWNPEPGSTCSSTVSDGKHTVSCREHTALLAGGLQGPTP